MHIICTKNDLLNGVNIVLKAVSTRTTLSILKCILLDAHNDEFKLTGNDLELGIEHTTQANIIKAGQVAVDAKIFSEIIRKLPDSDVEIIVNEQNQMMITCEKSVFSIATQPATEYVQLPQIIKTKPLMISQNKLRNMIYQTIFSVSLEELRPILKGELFDIKNNFLNIVAIDGYRVGLRQTELEEEFENTSVVIPGKTLSEIQKILSSEDDENIAIYFTENHILFEMDKSIIVSRLLEGEFPKYDQIFLSDYETLIRIDRKKMIQGIERAALMAVDSKKNPIKLSIKEDIVAITSNTDLGNVREEISIECEGNSLDIAFNPKYLIDALKVIDDDEVILTFTSSLNPCIIKSNTDKNLKYLVLPIRLS